MSLFAIIAQGVRTGVRSWVVLFFYLAIRAAATIAGFLPFILLLVLVFRVFQIAPIDPETGMPDFGTGLAMLLTTPRVAYAIAGIMASAFAIRFVVASLADAGLVGELADALEDRRRAGIGGFFANAARLFGRVAAIRVVAEMGSLLVFIGAAALVFKLYLWTGGDLNDPPSAVIFLAAIPIFTLAALCSVALSLLAIAAILATAVEHLSLAVALKRGSTYLTDAILPMASIWLFFTIASAMIAITSAAGDSAWMSLMERSNNSDWLSVAANSWGIAAGLFAAFLWMMQLTSQLALYRSRLNQA